MTTLPQTFRHSMPIEIVDDEDVALLLRRENVDPLVCISVEEIGHESPEMKPKPPQSSHNLHVNTMHELQRSNVHNMAAHLDDIGEGLTPVANIDTSPHSHLNFRDTTGNQHIPEHDETEPLKEHETTIKQAKKSTTEKEAGDDVGVLLTETMASNLADEELVYHRSTTVASRRTHGRRLAGRATRGNSTATRRRGIGQLVGTGGYRARELSG
ncbi:hypothetical protein Q3G72_021270 [Acer saccharum]|nr:hypothetical protein Q3G72_021270 [Acer saccharum]